MDILKKFWIPVLIVLMVVGIAAWAKRDWLVARAYIVLLEWDWRVQRLQVERVTAALGVVPGQKVVDLGAGSGIFTRSLAESVGSEGVVYAVDISQPLLDFVEESAREHQLQNVRTVLAVKDDPLIPEPVDLIFICDTLHHIADRAEYLESLRQYLKPSGRVAIIDFIKSPHLFSSDDYSLKELEFWLKEAGYEPTGHHTFLQNNFFVVYECPDCPGPRLVGE